MNNIKRKLRSKAGASMILALLFLMFCSFVGGSVLVSATANAYRVAHLQEQQDFLHQRSAALLLAEELRLAPGKYLNLKVVDSDLLIEELEYVNEGATTKPTGRAVKQRNVTFLVETNDAINEVQRLMLEMTMWRYLVAEAKKLNTVTTFNVEVDNLTTAESHGEVQISAFNYALLQTTGNSVTLDPATVSAIECKLNVTAQWMGNVSGIASTPEFVTRCTSGSGTDIYDFFVDLGEDSVVKLTLESIVGTNVVLEEVTYDPVAVPVPGLSGSKNLSQTTETKVETVIYWQNPEIEKGGA